MTWLTAFADGFRKGTADFYSPIVTGYDRLHGNNQQSRRGNGNFAPRAHGTGQTIVRAHATGQQVPHSHGGGQT